MGLAEKKKEMELKKIAAAICELEYRIEERKEDIKRMEDHIILQKQREEEVLQDKKGDK